MDHVRSALYVDFDNVFGAFLDLDPVLGMAFAERPGDWLDQLSELLGHADRRWLVRRCYMNPTGSVPDPNPDRTQRLYFSNLRSNFTQAGFEVIDCPPLTSRYKTASDMHIVVDAMDALAGPVHYDDFVIVSGDADFTPLLVRLRADDRRIIVLAPSNAAEAFRATADLVVSGEEALALLEQPSTGEEAAPHTAVPSPPAETGSDASDQSPEVRFSALVRARYEAAPEALNLAALAAEARQVAGEEAVRATDWFGAGGFTNALRLLGLPGARLSQQYLWDAERHSDPTLSAQDEHDVPISLHRLIAATRMPQLSRDIWPMVYEALAEYAATQEYHLTDASRWPRDYLDERGVHVGRNPLAFVVRGLASSAAPLYRRPSPTPSEIGTAFLHGLLERGPGSQLSFSADEVFEIADYLGVTDTSGFDGVP